MYQERADRAATPATGRDFTRVWTAGVDDIGDGSSGLYLPEMFTGDPAFGAGPELLSPQSRAVRAAGRVGVEVVLKEFCDAVQRGYLASNPYHNAIHAADVLQTVSSLLGVPKLGEGLTALQRLALLVAAMIHDYQHVGRSNAFLVTTGHPLALRYNDRSVLENMHVSEAWALFRDATTNILGEFSDSMRRAFREDVIELVLSTDLKNGFQYISRFKNTLRTDPELEEAESVQSLMVMVIKCADVSHPAKRLDLHRRWTALITDEFYQQGDEERARGVPISPLCDRFDASVAKGSLGFIDFVVKPALEPLSEFAGVDTWLSNLHTNFAFWKGQVP